MWKPFAERLHTEDEMLLILSLFLHGLKVKKKNKALPMFSGQTEMTSSFLLYVLQKRTSISRQISSVGS